MKNHFKFLTFVLIAFVHGQILAAPAVFFNDNLTAGRTSFTNTVNSATAVGGGTPIIYIVDIGALKPDNPISQRLVLAGRQSTLVPLDLALPHQITTLEILGA